MNDNMDEEFDRGGVSLARGVTDGHQAFSSAQGPAGSSAGPFAQAGLWARKRGRASLGATSNSDREVTNFPQSWEGDGIRNGTLTRGNLNSSSFVPIVGRESPDSDMSSGSDVSINRGIKRMRLDRQQQQHQHFGQQLSQQLQLSRATSAFGPYTPSDGRPTPTWSGTGSPESSSGKGFFGIAQQQSSTASDASLGTHGRSRHQSPVPVRSVPDGQIYHTADSTLISKTSAGSAIQGEEIRVRQQSAIGGASMDGVGASTSGGGAPSSTRSGSFDTCVAFSPFAPRPPAQAKYVKGIRVEANAPSDVDYSNVNNTLRQLHIERRMASSRASLTESGGSGGDHTVGSINSTRPWPQTYAWRET